MDDLPQPFKAISYLMVARYAVQATVVNEFSCSVKEECTPEALWAEFGTRSVVNFQGP